MHLVKKWLPILDKKMEASFEHAHPNYRLFISAEPAADPLYHIIPQVLSFQNVLKYFLIKYTFFINVGGFGIFDQNY